MKLLALDTSSLACSVAIRAGEAVFERHEEQPREHTRLLIPMIRSLLEESAVGLPELDAIVLGNGPGSFIGIRIAASVAQGLAFGTSLEIAPVSSLAAIAVRAFHDPEVREVVVAQDAHMNEVYLGLFERGADGLPSPLLQERLQAIDVIPELEPAAMAGRVAAGFGWQRYPDLLQINRDRIGGEAGPLHPRARDLLVLGARTVRAGETVQPRDVLPAYLRQQVAAKPSARP